MGMAMANQTVDADMVCIKKQAPYKFDFEYENFVFRFHAEIHVVLAVLVILLASAITLGVYLI
jgi:hypothetical protein